MLTSFEHYKYRLVKHFNSVGDKPKRRLYSFKSTKSNQTYHVWVECYPMNFYGIKFHLKSHSESELKYNVLTNLKEARPVIFTCIKIMLDIHREIDNSSFGFIGSGSIGTLIKKSKTGELIKVDIDEDDFNTKRYRRYKQIMITYISRAVFEHVENIDKSAYMLIRKSELEKDPNLIDKINMYFSDTYNNFD